MCDSVLKNIKCALEFVFFFLTYQQADEAINRKTISKNRVWTEMIQMNI